MNNSTPKHFSHCFELKTDQLPTRSSDRTNWRFQLPGIIFGLLLALLGAYELFDGFDHSQNGRDELSTLSGLAEYQPLITPTFFDIVFIIIGLGMVAASIASYIRYKKIIFDGKNVEVVYRPVFGDKTSFKENIKAYLGVRLRIELFQFGLINKNRYIIELYHKDPKKIIPLYISTSGKNIRRVWEKYAQFLNLPALLNTDSGLISRDVKNLRKSIKEMAELGYIVDEYQPYEVIPSSVVFVCKQDKIVLKARKIVWDAYNLLAWGAIVSIGSLLLLSGLKFDDISQVFSSQVIYALWTGGVLLIVISIFILFRKEKIVIKPHKIVNTHKYMLFSTKHDEMAKNDIEAIEITENPVSGRFYVAIHSGEKTIGFGSKLPIDDLRWIKKFLVHEIIK